MVGIGGQTAPHGVIRLELVDVSVVSLECQSSCTVPLFLSPTRRCLLTYPYFVDLKASAMVKVQGPGIVLTNRSHHAQAFAFYDNYWNGNGTAGANFDHPHPEVTLKAGESKWISLPESFKGRVQRGTKLPATWAEFQVSASDGKAWGDISLQQGCDGAATIKPTDGGTAVGGFEDDVISKAPKDACITRSDGVRALQRTVPNWEGGGCEAAIDWGRSSARYWSTLRLTDTI